MQRFFSTQHPQRQEQVRKTQSVIRMQVDAERLGFYVPAQERVGTRLKFDASSDQGEISNAISAICAKPFSRCSAVDDSPVTRLSLTVKIESVEILNFAPSV